MTERDNAQDARPQGAIAYRDTVPGPAQIYGFYEAMGWEPALGKTPGQLLAAMLGSWALVCAWDGEMLVGMGRVVSDGFLSAYVCGLGVLPEWRGRGVGGEMLRRLLQRCAARGLKPQLLCEDRLVPHYRRAGFDVFAVGMKLR